ncbi:MAG: rRNA ((1402)-N(4))-methyltransferase [Caulobacteraceae bacterium]|nr:rRNA ((1402)-N(4))-methyltransferase [Caulobacteraceae bacterium]
MSEAAHLSVMLDEVVEALSPAPGETVVDGTFGAGGYTRAFLARGARVVAFDRDPSAARFASGLGGDFKLIEARFSDMAEHFMPGSVDGVALDLGISSMQIDEAERGFSFMRDGPLDMRMEGQGPSAADLVNTAEPAELSRIFWLYGEEKQSRRIAAFLVRRRAERPFERTLDLAEVVERALGGRRGAKTHPATRVFQALRIAVNDELAELEAGLAAAESVLAPGGRLAVVSFHSLEDRIVKAFLNSRSGKVEGGSRHAPPPKAPAAASLTLQFSGAHGCSEAEAASNPRARSAKLRAAVRTAAPVWRAAA